MGAMSGDDAATEVSRPADPPAAGRRCLGRVWMPLLRPGVVLAIGAVVSAVVLTFQLTLTGDPTDRGLWAAIAAATVPVLVLLIGEYRNLFRKIVRIEPTDRWNPGCWPTTGRRPRPT